VPRFAVAVVLELRRVDGGAVAERRQESGQEFDTCRRREPDCHPGL